MTPTRTYAHMRTHTNINIFMLATRANNGKDRTRTLAMMGRMPGSRQEVIGEKEGVTFTLHHFQPVQCATFARNVKDLFWGGLNHCSK